jgi:hypothetical protein
MEDFYGTSSKNSTDRFCEMELIQSKCFFELRQHFNATSTVMLLVAIAGIPTAERWLEMSLLTYVTH